MQHRAEDERGPKCPNHSTLPISPEQKRHERDADDQDHIVVVIFLVRIRPDGLFDQPPEQIVQASHMREAA